MRLAIIQTIRLESMTGHLLWLVGMSPTVPCHQQTSYQGTSRLRIRQPQNHQGLYPPQFVLLPGGVLQPLLPTSPTWRAVRSGNHWLQPRLKKHPTARNYFWWLSNTASTKPCTGWTSGWCTQWTLIIINLVLLQGVWQSLCWFPFVSMILIWLLFFLGVWPIYIYI